ncbi:MAG: hypothetical protein J5502_05300 [Prevotella sp.]|nr:hypothetical protein [Prevotella sp.]
MKKFLMTLAAVLCCAMTTTVLTACGDDDDDKKAPVDDTTPVSMTMVLTCEFTQDMLDYCDIVVKYSDESGEKSETVNSLTWTKTLTGKLPTTFKYSRTVTIKGGVDFSTIESFKYIKGCHGKYYCLTASGKQTNPSGNVSNASSGGGKGENMAALIQKGSLNEEHIYVCDANGVH